ncbi:MAG: metalloregulator ArsR/SmtB family transcription factor [Cryomorphaceae bacterium]|jgi:predicted transcriptional regulator|nr:metalloregulator ArsR/SmtB family transcription factor [Cryomorphaceae bacterium]
MGLTKAQSFTAEHNQKALFFKALGHPARIAIIEHILSVDTCICNDLVGILPLSQATISQHLRELKESQLIQGTVEGNAVCYCINPKVLNEIKKIIDGFISNSKMEQPNCC